MADRAPKGMAHNHIPGYPYVELRPGAHRPKGKDGRLLLRKLNQVGRRVRAPIKITSGLRTPREQWAAYQDYLHGGILAAPCCSKHYLHAWSECLRQCASNHCSSRAADCEILHNGEWLNIGLVDTARKAMRRIGLCLPVGSGEVWHVEVGSTWRS